MTHKQHPLRTPFTPASTADEVLAGIDLAGRNAIVTGGHADIGLEVTSARRGGRVRHDPGELRGGFRRSGARCARV